MVAAAQQLVTALQGNIPAGNKTAEGFNHDQRIIHKICISKEGGCQSKGAAKQTLGKPLGLNYNSSFKGGSTTTKGGRASSKGDQSHSG
jgi:hypothetical protein